MKYRIGQSTDIHKLVKNRKLILGGVEIESELGLLGHSDADVLTHVIMEAILGALALGDLGKHFSDTAEQYQNISSIILLQEVIKLMHEHNYSINNIDSLIMLEKPKLAPFISEIKNNLAKYLNCDLQQINIKATTSEKLGYIGRAEGVMAQAVVMLKRRDKNE
ncbi:MAG: 2-C-methyl-D-erythritol 2,4-cyclodiphosphate synthase [Erysipelotrichaceae bacterium]